MSSNQKKFNQEFIDSTVKMVLDGGKSASQVARDLGLPEWRVGSWVRKARRTGTSNPSDQNLAEENKRLRRELAKAQEEAEILKKAAAYFAQHQQ